MDRSDAFSNGVLRLSGGLAWRLASGGGAASWLSELASILGLEQGVANDCPRWIFFKGSRFDKVDENPLAGLSDDLRSLYPNDGWNVFRTGPLCFLTHTEARDLLCRLDPLENSDVERVEMQLFLYGPYLEVQKRGGLPLHSALVEWEGKGALLAATGGTGKSTCCHRIPAPWRALCDDEALVVRTRECPYRVHPFPTWSPYFLRGEKPFAATGTSIPLSAIFFLDRGPEDKAIPIGQGAAASLIQRFSEQVYGRNWYGVPESHIQEVRGALFQNCADLAHTVPCHILRLSPSGPFWEEIQRVLDFQ